MSTIIVFFSLKPGINEAQYLQWAKESDMPVVNNLSSILSFEVFKGISMLGQDKTSPWDYFEVIHISSEDDFLNDIQTEKMQNIIKKFKSFTEDSNFILTKTLRMPRVAVLARSSSTSSSINSSRAVPQAAREVRFSR